jgi:hypothetical protein
MTGDSGSCHAEQAETNGKSNSGTERVKGCFCFGSPCPKSRQSQGGSATQAADAEAAWLSDSDDVTISVTELSCREAGCPDVETVVAILREEEKPSIARVNKSIPDVTANEPKLHSS